LTYGDYPALAKRALDSISTHCPRGAYELIVGANAVSPASLQVLTDGQQRAQVDHLVVSPVNLNKCPMMRRMFARVRTELIWWFDDDSYISDPSAFATWVGHALAAPPDVVMWGQLNWCDSTIGFYHFNERATLEFVRAAPWYRGLPPPSWRRGGKGEFNYQGKGTGDGRWHYLAGGCWMIRTGAVRTLDWPDPRLTKMGDDTFLGEAVRQQGWAFQDIGCAGVDINTESRRGDPG
jgi:hypothetical protein